MVRGNILRLTELSMKDSGGTTTNTAGGKNLRPVGRSFATACGGTAVRANLPANGRRAVARALCCSHSCWPRSGILLRSVGWGWGWGRESPTAVSLTSFTFCLDCMLLIFINSNKIRWLFVCLSPPSSRCVCLSSNPLPTL